MTDYKKLYYSLFNSITDVSKIIESDIIKSNDKEFIEIAEKYLLMLRKTQLDAENLYIEQ